MEDVSLRSGFLGSHVDLGEITYQIDEFERILAVGLVALGDKVLKGGCVRREDGRVHYQQQDEPVPGGLERRIVQYREAVYRRRLQFVLREDISAQVEDLQHVTNKLVKG